MNRRTTGQSVAIRATTEFSNACDYFQNQVSSSSLTENSLVHACLTISTRMVRKPDLSDWPWFAGDDSPRYARLGSEGSIERAVSPIWVSSETSSFKYCR